MSEPSFSWRGGDRFGIGSDGKVYRLSVWRSWWFRAWRWLAWPLGGSRLDRVLKVLFWMSLGFMMGRSFSNG